MFRSVGVVGLGVVLAGAIVFGVEILGHRFYPPPENIDFNNREALRELLANAPVGALGFVLAAWGLGTCAGTAVAARLAPQRPELHGGVTGLFPLLAAVANMILLPHPTW